jgi:hypothetical protein
MRSSAIAMLVCTLPAVSAAGAHQVAIIDDRKLTVTSRVDGIRFPDGIAYAPGADKGFGLDEPGGAAVDAINGRPVLHVYEPTRPRA